MGIRREIYLDGGEYALSSLHERPYRRYAQSPIVGQDKDRYWFTWPQRSWHGGERMVRILSSADLEAARYDDGEGVDTSTWGQVTLQPALALSFACKSAAMPMITNRSGSKVLVGYATSPYVHVGSYSSPTIVWTATVTAPAAAPVDFCRAGSSVYAALSSGALSVTTDDGANWSASGSHTGLVGLAYVNQSLYGLKSAQVYNITDSEELVAYGGSYICGWKDSLYWGANNVVYCYDGNADYEYVQLPEGFTMTGLFPYRMALWILGYYKVQGGYKASVHYLMPGTENHLYTLGDYSADHRMYACCGGDDEVWFASPKRGGADRFDLVQGGLGCGPAIGSAMNIPFKGMASIDGFLLVGRYDAAGNNGTCQAGSTTTTTVLSASASADDDTYNGMTLRMATGTGAGQSVLVTDYVGSTRTATHAAVSVPADASTTYHVTTDGIYAADMASPAAYRSSGWFTTCTFDFGYAYDEKVIRAVRVEHDALTTGQSIKVEYSLDMGMTWNILGFSGEVGATSCEWQLTDAVANSLKMKLTLCAGGTAYATTPKLRAITAQGAPRLPNRWKWELALSAYRRNRGAQDKSELAASFVKGTPIPYIDRDGTEYTVVIDDIEFQEMQVDRDSAVMVITMRQV